MTTTRTLEQDLDWAQNRAEHFGRVALQGHTGKARSYGKAQTHFWTARMREIEQEIKDRGAQALDAAAGRAGA